MWSALSLTRFWRTAWFEMGFLEDVEDDQTSLCSLAAKLTRGGRLLIYVPVFQCLWTSLDERVKHYRRYRRRELERLAGSAGLTVLKTRYVDSLGFFVALGFKVFGNKNSHLSARAVSLYDRCVVPLSRLLDLLVNRLFDKNVYVIATNDYRPSAPHPAVGNPEHCKI
jgi:hypothetical protein